MTTTSTSRYSHAPRPAPRAMPDALGGCARPSPSSVVRCPADTVRAPRWATRRRASKQSRCTAWRQTVPRRQGSARARMRTILLYICIYCMSRSIYRFVTHRRCITKVGARAHLRRQHQLHRQMHQIDRIGHARQRLPSGQRQKPIHRATVAVRARKHQPRQRRRPCDAADGLVEGAAQHRVVVRGHLHRVVGEYDGDKGDEARRPADGQPRLTYTNTAIYVRYKIRLIVRMLELCAVLPWKFSPICRACRAARSQGRRRPATRPSGSASYSRPAPCGCRPS